MKKIVLIMVLFLAIQHTSIAQNAYFRTGMGYALPFNEQTADASGNLYSGTMKRSVIDSVNYDAYNIKNASFTSGKHFVLGFGYMFNERIGIDATFDLCVSPTKHSFDIYYDNVRPYPTSIELTQKASLPIMFTPALVLQTGGKKLNLYSRVGVVVPCYTKIIWDRIFRTYGTNKIPYTYAAETWEIRNKFSLGMSATMGVQKYVSKRMKLGAEVSFLSMSIVTKKATLTKFIWRGQNISIIDEPESETTINFSSNFKGKSTNFNEQPAYAQPFSNFAINISMTVTLGKLNAKVK